ncbi:hypothetical protein Bhyg_03209 [Pseudolycoriella hygida]|uniref:YqaJ viral recombinase domain-containing protein n=1 Tax=Pseudolycoriella hygida TaxID=35572 RepID=A0A9Q0NCZ1_9DIPT|nr:hypothetical protein Bhyg_03209 [Pseudolycoriella hygida]
MAEKHNNESQSIALQQLAKEHQLFIRECGLYIDSENMCLAASPAGITEDGNMIIEIQCPIAITSKDPTEPSNLLKLPYIGKDNLGVLGLKRTDDIYYQIQGQLHILDKSVCLFAIWTSTRCNMFIEKINRDEQFYKTKMENQLISFYYDWLLPELIDPRLKRNMQVREPLQPISET